jgi:predicted deacylase
MIDSIEEKLNHNIYGLTKGQRIAYQLQRLAHQVDYVLDLHTGPISSKHLYCPAYTQDSAKYFDIPHTILIPNDFDGALDEAKFCQWWSLQDAFAELGIEFSISLTAVNKESFTVELGSQKQIDLNVALDDAKSTMNYLQYKGVIITTEYQPKTMTRYGCYLKDYKAFYSPMGGMVDYLAEFGEPLAAGDPLHYISLDKEVIPILHFALASVNQGTELYKVFSEYFKLTV